jgi:N-acetylglucosaminyldiphosphoundecaprenol N-acetyl-beta-D-mannosaminyltransferase
VGAAFDFHTGRLKDSPRWIKVLGLQWLHRLAQEPRRLWRRYLLNNPRFIVQGLLQISGLRRFELGPKQSEEVSSTSLKSHASLP